jgi:transcriptional regulator with XRE-family HTH domain
MDYSRAIRIARSLADLPQSELAKKISVDPSLVSMLERGKRKPTRDILERIAEALEIPFHLFALLATEPADLTTDDSGSINRLAVGLTKLLLRQEKCDDREVTASSKKAQHSVRKSSRGHSQDSARKTA